jgi:hypothetical protein
MSRFAFGPLRSLLSTGVVMAVMASSAPASAHEVFPGELQSYLKNQCPAQCTLCHTSPQGGQANLKSSLFDTGMIPLVSQTKGSGEFFANHVRVWANGQKPSYPDTEAQLKAAIDALKTRACDLGSGPPCDSDGDGVGDVAELIADSNPDAPDKPGEYCIGPKYGCGATISSLPRERTATREAAFAMSLLGVGLVFLRRARRR